MNEKFLPLVERLRDTRLQLEAFDADAKAIKERYAAMLEADENYQAAKTCLEEFLSLKVDLEKQLREGLIAHYEETQEKGAARKDPAWVEISTVVEGYDVDKAFDHCLKNLTSALSINKTKFEKAVVDGFIPKDIAVVSQKPVVKIASKL